MNRSDVAQEIRYIGSNYGRVMACLQSEDYSAGYRQAVRDMLDVFEYKPVAQNRPKGKRFVLFSGSRRRRYERP